MLQQSIRARFLAGVAVALLLGMVPCSIFCESIDITINKKTKKDPALTWSKTVADVCAAINTQFNTINPSTSQQKVSQIFEEALKKIDAIKQEGRRRGMIIESVTLTMGSAPSVTMKLKIAEPAPETDSKIEQ